MISSIHRISNHEIWWFSPRYQTFCGIEVVKTRMFYFLYFSKHCNAWHHSLFLVFWKPFTFNFLCFSTHLIAKIPFHSELRAKRHGRYWFFSNIRTAWGFWNVSEYIVGHFTVPICNTCLAIFPFLLPPFFNPAPTYSKKQKIRVLITSIPQNFWYLGENHQISWLDILWIEEINAQLLDISIRIENNRIMVSPKLVRNYPSPILNFPFLILNFLFPFLEFKRCNVVAVGTIILVFGIYFSLSFSLYFDSCNNNLLTLESISL